MIREVIQDIGKKASQWFSPKQENMATISFERPGVAVSSPVNSAICLSLCLGPSEIGTLTESVNDIFNQVGTLETYQDVPVGQQTISEHLGTMFKYGIVEQDEEGKWSLTKSGQEVMERLKVGPRTEE